MTAQNRSARLHLLAVTESGSNKGKKVANHLVALSSAAVMAVYAAGYTRTRAAADRLELQSAGRRPAMPEVPEKPGDASPVLEPAPGPTVATLPTLPKPAVRPPATPAEPADSAGTLPPPLPPPEPATMVAAPAPEPLAVAAPAAPAAAVATVWKDGTYTGWGTSRHGDIQASVVIEGGRIASATIAQCLTRYSCSVIEKLPPEVSVRQSPEVDYVSGATQSANAFYYAVVEALGKAK